MAEKKVNFIKASKGAMFLSEFMETLPYGILNKGETGCGATSLMLENPENVIICCPTRQLINSKTSQYPNERCNHKVLGVQEGITKQKIEEYIESSQSK